MSDKKIVVQLDSSEMATVLAALRCFQNIYASTNVSTTIMAQDFPDHFADTVPLDVQAIDTLCERIEFDIPNKAAYQSHARLIAAAPELLEAAADLLSARDRTNQSLRDALRRAVLKAGGEIYSQS